MTEQRIGFVAFGPGYCSQHPSAESAEEAIKAWAGYHHTRGGGVVLVPKSELDDARARIAELERERDALNESMPHISALQQRVADLETECSVTRDVKALLERDVADLRAALEKYGDHLFGCARIEPIPDDRAKRILSGAETLIVPECTCGFDAAIARTAPPVEPGAQEGET